MAKRLFSVRVEDDGAPGYIVDILFSSTSATSDTSAGAAIALIACAEQLASRTGMRPVDVLAHIVEHYCELAYEGVAEWAIQRTAEHEAAKRAEVGT